ncbi:MAG: KH domain-containing protein [Tissierellia bacterium]|nr:KH domain-containing protein [Tissierellia bacterium]
MKELLQFIVENLVQNKEAIQIREEEVDGNTTFFLSVDENDMGRVIGRKGRIANSIRTILRASQHEDGKNVYVEIED